MTPAIWLDDAVAHLRARVQRLTRRFDARPRRERMVLLVAVGVLVFWAADRLWVTPAFERSRAVGVRLAQAQADLAALRADSARLQALAVEQERQLQADLAQWRERVDRESAALRAYENTLVRADRMVDLLEQMLPRHGRVKVRELRSLPRTDLLAANAAAAGVLPAATGAASAPAAPKAGDAALYRHGVELTLEGGWSDLLQYLQALETMPRRVLWGGLNLKVERHPTVVMTVRIYTLSLDRGWLEI